MKNWAKYILAIGLLSVTVSLLSACGGGGGGSAAVTPAAVGASAVSANPLFIGQGTWQGTIAAGPGYQLYLNTNGCSGGTFGGGFYPGQGLTSCVATGTVQVTIDTTNTQGGYLPGMVTFSITNPGSLLATNYQTAACSNTSANGLVMNYYNTTNLANGAYPNVGLTYNNGGSGNVNNLCQLAINPGQAAILVVNAQFPDMVGKASMAIQIYYQGQVLASGTIYGSVYSNNAFGNNGWGINRTVIPGANPVFAPYQQGGAGAITVFRQGRTVIF